MKAKGSMNPTTSFRELREAGACQPRYRHLARKLGGIKNYGEDTPITSRQILEANGPEDVDWAWRYHPSFKPMALDYRVKCRPIWRECECGRISYGELDASILALITTIIEEWDAK